jgi:adenylosuccinate synthase
MLPSAALNTKTKLAVGAGVLVNPEVLIQELRHLTQTKEPLLMEIAV